MHALWRLRLALFAVALAALTACGAHDVAGDGSDAFESDSQDALTNCDPNSTAIFLELRDYGDRTTSDLYKDVDLVERAVALAPGDVVRHDPGDVRMTGSRARRSDAIVVTTRRGDEGWIPMNAVRVRMPSGSGGGAGAQCQNGVDPTARASAALRIATADDSLPLALARSAVACGLGLGEGAFAGGRDLLVLVAKALAVTPDVAQALFEVDKDLFFAALGRADAVQRLADRAVAMRDRAESVAALLLHTIPMIQAALRERYTYYQMLDAQNQSRMLCGIIGRLSFEVLLGVGTSLALEKAPLLLGRVLDAHVEAARTLAIPGRSGGVADLKILVDAAADEARSNRWGWSWGQRVRQERDLQVRWLATLDDDLKIIANRSASAEERLAAMDRISTAANPPERVAGTGPYPNHQGNCAFAALTLLATVSTGHAQCALPYLDEQHFSNGIRSDLAVWGMGEPSFGSASDVASAAASLDEGELAILFSRAWRSEVEQSAHATVLVKLEGRVYNVNNQGWFAHEPIEGWTQRWESRGFSRVAYGITRGSAKVLPAR